MTTRIEPSQLLPGDALIVDTSDTEHHMVLLEAWASDHAHFTYSSFGGGASGTAPPDRFTDGLVATES